MARVDKVCPMLPPQLIVAGIIAVASATTGFGVAWKIQSGLRAERELEYAEQQLENQRLVAATRTRQDQALIAAQNAAQVHAAGLRMAADAARSATSGLRDAISTTVRDADTSVAACTQRAVALGELLSAATESHRELAEKADRHASDVHTLTQAWPQ